MKDLTWGYYNDGQWADQRDKITVGSQSYSFGRIANIAAGGGLKNKTLQFITVFDGASFGGTTLRAKVDGDMGRTIPGDLFSARQLDLNRLYLIVSAGGLEEAAGFGLEYPVKSSGNGEIEFTVTRLKEANGDQYLGNMDRIKLLNDADDYAETAKKAEDALLSADEFNALLQMPEFDTSNLREKDKAAVAARAAEAQASFDAVEQKTLTLAEYFDGINQNVLAPLADLETVTATDYDSALALRPEIEKNLIFASYAQGDVYTGIWEKAADTDMNLIPRAGLHLAIADLEATVKKFADDPSSATVAELADASQFLDDINIDDLEFLSESDKAAFTERYDAASELLSEAKAGRDFETEYERLSRYDARLTALGALPSAAELKAVTDTRYQVDFSNILPYDKGYLISYTEAVDEKTRTLIGSILDGYIGAYGTATDELLSIGDITADKINAAVSAAYQKADLEILAAISGAYALDISEKANALSEQDRIVSAARELINLTAYAGDAANNSKNLSDVYASRDRAVASSKSAILSSTEISAAEEFLSQTDAAFSARAKTEINEKIALFSAAVDRIDFENPETVEGLVNAAKTAKNSVPDLKFLVVQTDYDEVKQAYDEILAELKQSLYYYVNTSGEWTTDVSDNRLILNGVMNESVAYFEDPIDIKNFDMVIDFSRIGYVFQGMVDGKNPESVLVVNIMREKGKIKDATQGFSIYLKPNVLNEIEVMIYGAKLEDEQLLAQGKLPAVDFTAEDYQPFDVRITVEKLGAPLNCYKVWINNLEINLYYRSFVNVDETKGAYLPGYAVGDEIGEELYIGDMAYVTFVIFGQELEGEKKELGIGVKMIGDTAFGGYVAPKYLKDIRIVSPPVKTTYVQGESIDLSGLKMTAFLNDGTTLDIPISDIKVSGFVSTSAGTRSVSLKYTYEGRTMEKVIRMTITAAESGEGLGAGAIIGIVFGSVGGVLLIGGAVVLMVLKRKGKLGGKKNENK
jgi:hypothetical protein